VDRSGHAAVVDELALRALVARYCHAIAQRDDDAWAATWAPDAEWQVLGKTLRGREAILAHYQALVRDVRLVMQFADNGLIELEGDRARGRWLVTETIQWNDGRAGLNLGVYRDDYRQDPAAGWRFARREFLLRYFGPPDLSAVPAPRSEPLA
jgi:ketosteroid isomerase-like protein